MHANTLSIDLPANLSRPKAHILCVDDEPSILRALSWLLKKDFHVVTALSAHEGLALIRSGDFDVVISDQRMPEMSGVDFLNEVRQLAPRAMRILLTGYSDMQAVLRSVNESEIFRYVNKPWDVNELPAIVAQAADIARKLEVAPLPAAPAEADSPPLAKKTKLMVIDDDASTHSTVEMSAGDLAEVIHVTSPVDALQMLETEDIGVILAERSLGSMDLTHLLCLLKRRHPTTVSIVLTETLDSSLITRMINQGQIYRFITKPAKAGLLRLTLKSALTRHEELCANPALTERYRVADTDPQTREAIQAGIDAHLNAHSTSSATPGDDLPVRISLFGAVGNLMRRVFGS